MIRTRVAEAADFDQCLSLISALLVELGAVEIPPEQVRSVFADLIGDGKHGFIILAEDEGHALGVCSVSLVHALRTRGVYGVIQEMYVQPEVRSLGVGSSLLAASLEHAAGLGCQVVELGTPTGGERQIKFYADNGFKVVGERLRWARPD